MTYSVVARDPDTAALGVACQSHFFAVGRAVNHAEAGAGAIANQSLIEPAYARLGLAALREGATAQQALDAGLAADPLPELRQVAIADARGGLAVHTGKRCVGAAGARAGDSWLVQGNMLASEAVLDAMAAAMAAGGPLVDRMLAALAAADAAGGDLRGRQAAGIRVVAAGEPDDATDGVLLDLRVEDAPDPVAELTRLVGLARSSASVLGVLAGEGVLVGEYREPRPGATDAALATLAAVAGEDSEAGLEAQLWHCVLLTRAGRTAESATAARALLGRRPELRQFLHNLAEAGYLERSPA
ncbi:DUF1028 domain-containing protein [Pseudonocardia sp.]|uniref:DUF1028 domain-containing protein n=1 Tax=Pseudonocardia sp. TaxID=60912 RepID=UPI003D15196E